MSIDGKSNILYKIKIWYKVQASVAVQQGHQWCITWLRQLQQFIVQLYDEQHAQYAKNIILNIFTSVHRGWQEVQFQFYNTQWSTIDLYRQFGNFHINKGIVKIY